MAGKGGGAWKVAYADFVTAMMAFFMVMWITSQSKDARESVAEYFKDPFGQKSKEPPTGQAGAVPRGAQSSKDRKARGRRQGESLAKTVPPDGPKDAVPRNAQFMIIHDGRNSVEGIVVRFAEGSAELSQQTQVQLAELLPQLVSKRNKIEIRGHTSPRPLPPGNPFPDNWRLSYARCQAVLACLEQHGVKRERIRLSQASEYEPLTVRPDPESQAENSRVEVYLLHELPEDYQGRHPERQESSP